MESGFSSFSLFPGHVPTRAAWCLRGEPEFGVVFECRFDCCGHLVGKVFVVGVKVVEGV